MGFQWILLEIVILFQNTPKDSIAMVFALLAIFFSFGGYYYAIHKSPFMADSRLRFLRGFLIALIVSQLVPFSALAGFVFFALIGLPVRG